MMRQDFVAQGGIGSTIDVNPFKDWTFIVIPYASGEFHAGPGEYHYTEKKKWFIIMVITIILPI